MRCALGAATIPTSVKHLLLQQMIGKGVKAAVFILEVTQNRNHHAGYTSFTPANPVRPHTVIDASIGLHAPVEQRLARFSRLSVLGRQTEVAKQEHSVSRGRPLR